MIAKVIVMQKGKIKNLEKKGWKVGTMSDFLNLTREEEEDTEMKKKKDLTQVQVAAKIKSSQSRVAKIERA